MQIERAEYSFSADLIVESRHQAPVVRKVDNAIHRINHYPADSVVCFANTYPLDSDLSGGYFYPPFEQLGPVVQSVYSHQYN